VADIVYPWQQVDIMTPYGVMAVEVGDHWWSAEATEDRPIVVGNARFEGTLSANYNTKVYSSCRSVRYLGHTPGHRRPFRGAPLFDTSSVVEAVHQAVLAYIEQHPSFPHASELVRLKDEEARVYREIGQREQELMSLRDDAAYISGQAMDEAIALLSLQNAGDQEADKYVDMLFDD